MLDKFWLEPFLWPRDPKGKRFLARVVGDVGRHLFASEWSDRDPAARPLRPIDPFGKNPRPWRTPQISSVEERRTSFHSWQNYRVDLLLNELRPGFRALMGPSPFPPSLSSPLEAAPPPSLYFTEEEWETARAENQRRIEHDDPGAEAFKRFWASVHRIVEWATDGSLRTYAREKANVTMTEISADHWAVISIGNMFSACQIDLNRPANIASAGDGFDWVFVDILDLQACLNSLSPAAAESVQNQTSSERTRRVAWLTTKLKEDRDYKRAWAAKEFDIPSSGSAMSSIWKDARRGAGLPEKGNPGAPPKAKQTTG